MACRTLRIAVATGALLMASSNGLRAAPQRPNILVVLTDDLGYSDLGCYGSEIATPTLDRLAAGGLRFSQFYNTAKCHSSRVSLLSGRWCIQAGDTKLNRAVTIPEVLREAGYFTAMTGKWHLSRQPTDFGFDRYFGHLSGACNYFRGDTTFRLNGQPWTVPEDGFYTTVANVDFALQFLDEARDTGRPWFLYVAFNAPHAPLQPMKADYERYRRRYEQGWDVVRNRRHARQNAIGLFGRSVAPSPRPGHIPAWDALTPEFRDWESRRMAAYAAMVDRVDREIGRLVADLEANGEFDNTLILFFSDNGACPYDRRSRGMNDAPYEPATHWSDSTGWAWARNCPFRYYKQNQFEGGIATPAIAHWPAGITRPAGGLIHTPAHLVDVLPTAAAVAGAPIPSEWPDRQPTPLAGVSLAPLFAGAPLPNRPPIHLLFSSDRGLRDGDWKLVSFRRRPWELYNIASDRCELRDLADKHPGIVSRMARQWHRMAEQVLGAQQRLRTPVADTAEGPHVHPEWTDFRYPAASGERRRKRPQAKRGIRARIGTTMQTRGPRLVLQCSGTDPGLAFDRLPEMGNVGPYTLTWRQRGDATGNGEIYWTTNPATKLPQGGHRPFDITHGADWSEHQLTIAETKRLYALRFDPCGGEGTVEIEGLVLRDREGNTVTSWP